MQKINKNSLRIKRDNSVKKLQLQFFTHQLPSMTDEHDMSTRLICHRKYIYKHFGRNSESCFLDYPVYCFRLSIVHIFNIMNDFLSNFNTGCSDLATYRNLQCRVSHAQHMTATLPKTIMLVIHYKLIYCIIVIRCICISNQLFAVCHCTVPIMIAGREVIIC